MRILKIYIQNFKWIDKKEVISLDKDITFLTWPNGFWKTTIFDVIEICLTWELYRITNEKTETSKIVDWRTSIWKPFYQNNDKKPVLLKLLIELNNWAKKIIIAYDDNKGKRTKPAKLHFNRFIEDYNESDNAFETKDNWFKEDNFLDNWKIRELLNLKKWEDISNIYKIFNYLQQEETTFFLKQSAYNRHGNLNFLFKTKDEYDKQQEVEMFKGKINDISKKLSKKVLELKNNIAQKEKIIDKKEKIKYIRFFDITDWIISKSIDFDNDKLFDSELWEENLKYKEKYINNLNNLKDFLNTFEVEEYNKKLKKESINEIRLNEKFIEYFLLQKFDWKEEYLKLESYNDIYNFSKKKNYLEYLMCEKFLTNEEFEKIKEKAFLYNLWDENNLSITYFILQNIINNEKYIEELNIKNSLFKYIDKESNLLDVFLLEKFNDKKNELEKEYDLYNWINYSENILIKWFILHNFFKKTDNILTSEYEELEKFYKKYIFLKNYKLEKYEIKLNLFNQILEKLEKNNSDLSIDFNNNIKRKKELESDLSDNDKIISELNDLRKNLVDFYENNINNKIFNFNNTCLLCWTNQVTNEKTSKKIENLNIFKSFVEEKTSNINKISNDKSKKLDEVNKEIGNNLKILEEELDIIVLNEENKAKVNLFENINKYLNQNNYDKYAVLIESLLDRNIDLIINKVDFENIEEKFNFLKEKFLTKYEESYYLYNELNKIEWKNNVFIDKSILNSFLMNKNIDFDIKKENFNNLYYTKKKNTIIDYLKNYTKWFNEWFYTILNNLANSKYKKIYKENAIKLNDFLWDRNQDFLINNLDSIMDLSFYESNLNKYIKDITLDYFLLYQKIYILKEEEKYLNIEQLKLLKDLLNVNNLTYFRLENVKDYNESDYKKNLLSFEEKIFNFFKNKIVIFDILKKLRENEIYNTFNILKERIKECKIKELDNFILNDYDEYSRFIDLKVKIISILDDYIDKIEIDNKKLWWDLFYILNDIFSKETSLIKKYKMKKDDLNLKYKYIEYKYFELENTFLDDLKQKYKLLNNRLLKLENNKDKNVLISKINNLINIYDKNIKTYKKEMVDWIKIPFFIYTAKILQNFQQWMWIYVSVKFWNEKWDDYKKETIVFHSDWKSENDVMHQLSSWQLSVVSIAFTLSINKAYKLSDELNFLNIDDPVQELDSLNIHSFIELIRHSFQDYKFIISTHNDESAYFMKYKIEKIKWENTVSLLNVQNKFFSSLKSNKEDESK